MSSFNLALPAMRRYLRKWGSLVSVQPRCGLRSGVLEWVLLQRWTSLAGDPTGCGLPYPAGRPVLAHSHHQDQR
eukprot:COSAG05_NODE_1642_length_4354_cov_27.365687_3_plen_74_part_00